MIKYELTNETINVDGHTLHRIKALRDFGNVKKGDLGGFIQSETNLAHDGLCWVFNNAIVSDNAKVSGNVTVSGDAILSGNGEISGNIHICRGTVLNTTNNDQ